MTTNKKSNNVPQPTTDKSRNGRIQENWRRENPSVGRVTNDNATKVSPVQPITQSVIRPIKKK